MERFACVVNNVNFITWSTCDQVKVKFALIALLYIWLFSGKTEVEFWYLQGYITLDR